MIDVTMMHNNNVNRLPRQQPNDAILFPQKGTLNYPLRDLRKDPTLSLQSIMRRESVAPVGHVVKAVYLLCRRGVNSKVAQELLNEFSGAEVELINVRGGLEAWREYVDKDFPLY